MRIRLEGTQEEIGVAVEKIQENFTVVSVSQFYRNTRKGNPEHGRCYLEVTFPNEPKPRRFDAV